MKLDWSWVRSQIVGADAIINTPYGGRRLFYADYTASGRAVSFIEEYVQSLLPLYANTHTEDDTTGLTTTERMHAAEALIKKRLGADDSYALIAVGSGATGAINRLQEILGVYIPPATRARLDEVLAPVHPTAGAAGPETAPLAALQHQAPVVFVGPYEHHSNEISWRECFAETVEIALGDDGFLDLGDLEAKLADPQYQGRQKIGSFSAASNVSGIRTDVYRVAEILHAYDALVFFDFSASAPYVEIDVNHSDSAYFDAIFFSPHKFIGGPGSSGLLVFKKNLYRSDLPPCEAGGGTVSFVSEAGQDYVDDIEAREKSGTPGIIQTMRAALAVDLKDNLGIEEIEAREHAVTKRVLDHFAERSEIGVMGTAPAEKRLSIVSFTVRYDEWFLHPRFVVRLLNDLFGIQARAGCSCAGPYGHRLLHIGAKESAAYRELLRHGNEGVKPGWARMNFHYLFSDEEVDRLLEAVDFLAQHGYLFLKEYRFDLACGGWSHPEDPDAEEEFSAAAAAAWAQDAAAAGSPVGTRGHGAGGDAPDWAEAMSLAKAKAAELAQTFSKDELELTAEGTIRFWYYNVLDRAGCPG